MSFQPGLHHIIPRKNPAPYCVSTFRAFMCMCSDCVQDEVELLLTGFLFSTSDLRRHTFLTSFWEAVQFFFRLRFEAVHIFHLILRGGTSIHLTPGMRTTHRDRPDISHQVLLPRKNAAGQRTNPTPLFEYCCLKESVRGATRIVVIKFCGRSMLAVRLEQRSEIERKW